jgi:beta-galactosidase
MYFQWRAGRFGTEKFHSAILGHRGIRSRTWEECSALGNELKNMGELVGTRVQTPVAMLADWNSRWALESPEAMPSVGFNWIDLARSWNRALAKMGLQVDVVNYKSDLEQYKILLVPNAYLISAESAQSIEKYVANGGTVVVGPFSGTVDDNDHVHLGGAPGPLTKLLGISVDEWWPMIDGAVENIRIFDQDFGLKNWSESLECTTASTLGTYSTGYLRDRPAITANQFEKGLAIYVSADLEVDGLEAILRHAIEVANINLIFSNPSFGIDATIRTDGIQQYLSVVNFGEENFKLADEFVGYDLCKQKDFTKSNEILAKDAVVIRLDKPHVW